MTLMTIPHFIIIRAINYPQFVTRSKVFTLTLIQVCQEFTLTFIQYCEGFTLTFIRKGVILTLTIQRY